MGFIVSYQISQIGTDSLSEQTRLKFPTTCVILALNLLTWQRYAAHLHPMGYICGKFETNRPNRHGSTEWIRPKFEQPMSLWPLAFSLEVINGANILNPVDISWRSDQRNMLTRLWQPHRRTKRRADRQTKPYCLKSWLQQQTMELQIKWDVGIDLK